MKRKSLTLSLLCLLSILQGCSSIVGGSKPGEKHWAGLANGGYVRGDYVPLLSPNVVHDDLSVPDK